MSAAPLLDDYEIGPMRAGERNYVYDSWMRSSRWRRESMVRTVDAGQVLVCRAPDGDFILGWLCTLGDAAAFGVVRAEYREIGVMRALWEAAGRPVKVLPPAKSVAYAVLRRLRGDR